MSLLAPICLNGLHAESTRWLAGDHVAATAPMRLVERCATRGKRRDWAIVGVADGADARGRHRAWRRAAASLSGARCESRAPTAEVSACQLPDTGVLARAIVAAGSGDSSGMYAGWWRQTDPALERRRCSSTADTAAPEGPDCALTASQLPDAAICSHTPPRPRDRATRPSC
jgi:hypothetical protein